MIYGEIVQRWRLAQGAVLRKWPHKSGGNTLEHISTDTNVFKSVDGPSSAACKLSWERPQSLRGFDAHRSTFFNEGLITFSGACV